MKNFLQIIGFLTCTFGLFYLLCLNHLEPTQVGIARNLFSGETKLQETGGWRLSPPWVRVSVIDTRPLRVGVFSSGRGVDAKLVRFEPKFYREFLAAEGFRYYWWSNRFSFNWGHTEEHRGMKDLLRGYSYSAKQYPFVVIVEEYRQQ